MTREEMHKREVAACIDVLRERVRLLAQIKAEIEAELGVKLDRSREEDT